MYSENDGIPLGFWFARPGLEIRNPYGRHLMSIHFTFLNSALGEMLSKPEKRSKIPVPMAPIILCKVKRINDDRLFSSGENEKDHDRVSIVKM